MSQWRYAPALAPPPPAGVPPAPNPVPLGDVGQISFWAPNRGLLITGGTEELGGPVPAGLYAFDGVSWHELSSVCGGAKGRIAWAGPDEFWTISDQRAGQVTADGQNAGALEALSLCHFADGQVVGSYALPLGEPDSYMEMDAAACLGSNDCWFAGQDGQSPHLGSFHLHWDGQELTAIYDASDHAVAGMASYNGRIYEGLAIDSKDKYLPDEEELAHPETAPAHPPVIRTIAPDGQTPLCSASGEPDVFCDVFLFSAGHTLPLYPEHALPGALGGFDLATDGSPLGTGATQLWASADPSASAPPGSGVAKPTILRNAKGSWTQILPASEAPSPLPAGATLSGSSADITNTRRGEPGANAIAPEPGTEGAWLSLNDGAEAATVAFLPANGASATIEHLPGPEDPVGFRGYAGPIVCPAQGDCWMATDRAALSASGWLFHLTGGLPSPPNTDPFFDGEDGVIAYRPPDSGVPTIYPDGFAEDDSLANQQPAQVSAPAPAPPPRKPVKAKKGRPLVTHVKSRFIHHRILVISFTLTARAHVQLIGRRDKRIVAKTPNRSLLPGAHRLSLAFDLAHWPTKLQFEAKPLHGSAPAIGDTEGSGSSDTVGT
jgi:hypothetical protein